MIPKVDVHVDTPLLNGMKAFPADLRKALTQKVRSLAIGLQSYIKTSKLSGQVLAVRSGKLRRSIYYKVTETSNSVSASVGSQGVPYASIHEFGGVTRPHLIVAKRAKALRFQLGGKTVFAKYVNHPGSVIPQRSYLASALRDYEHIIVSELAEVPAQVLAKRGIK